VLDINNPPKYVSPPKPAFLGGKLGNAYTNKSQHNTKQMKKIISITFATVLGISSVFISVGCSGDPPEDPNANKPVDQTSPEDDDKKKKADEDKALKDGGVGFGEQKEPKATPAPVPTPTKPKE
jgi:hypothetical protein